MSEAKRPADFLKGIMREARSMSGRAEMNQALGVALGEDQALHCHVVGFRSGRLVVEVDSAPLFSELSGFRREEIRESMNQVLERNKIAQITFRMGGTGHV